MLTIDRISDGCIYITGEEELKGIELVLEKLNAKRYEVIRWFVWDWLLELYL